MEIFLKKLRKKFRKISENLEKLRKIQKNLRKFRKIEENCTFFGKNSQKTVKNG